MILFFDFRLPGTKKGDLSARASKPQVMVTGLEFSPTGREFAAATTEGLLMYSLDSKMIFDPFELEEDVTPKSTRQMLKDEEYDRALSMALRLNEPDLIREVIEQIPPNQVKRSNARGSSQPYLLAVFGEKYKLIGYPMRFEQFEFKI